MKNDAQKYATEIRLNRYGMVDVEYYRRKAVQMRAECTAEMFAYAVNQLKALTSNLLLRLAGTKIQPSH